MSTNSPLALFSRKGDSTQELRNSDLEDKVVKVIAGHGHAVCLLNNGEMYGVGSNEFGQYGSNPTEEDNSKFIGLKKVNVIDNPILQQCKVIDIFTKYNYTIYLAIHNETKTPMLLASGWNLGGCCSCNTASDNVHKIAQCYFLPNPGDNWQKDRPRYQNKLTQELVDEKIVKISCGGCHLLMLTEDNNTKEQYVYECGKNYANQISELADIPVLRKSKKIREFIKLNDENNFKIKQIEAGTCCTYLVTESGKLFVIGENNLCGSKGLQLIPQSLFGNESVVQVSDCLNITLVLTNSGTLYEFHKNARGNFSKPILQIHPTSSHVYVLFEDLSIYDFEPFSEGKYTSLMEVVYENEFDEKAVLLPKYLEQSHDYNFTLLGDNIVYVVAQKKEKGYSLIHKLKDSLMTQNGAGKNHFRDVVFN